MEGRKRGGQGGGGGMVRDAILHVFAGSDLRRGWMDWGALQVLGAGAIQLPQPTVEHLKQTTAGNLTVAQLERLLLAAKAAPATGQAYGLPHALTWNIGTIGSTTSPDEMPSASGIIEA